MEHSVGDGSNRGFVIVCSQDIIKKSELSDSKETRIKEARR
jgi:hypothetical protein